MANLSQPWLIDGRTGAVTLYEQLLSRLNCAPLQIRSQCQPASMVDALMEITVAVAFGAKLNLFDADFGERELAALGYSKVGLNLPEPVVAAAPIDLPALQALAAGRSSARLGLFTSGSTGLPKLVWQTVANLARAVKVSPRQAEAVWALAYNPTHIAGIQVYLQALANGCTLVDVYGLDRPAVLAALERHKVTHISATPSFYRLLLPVQRPLPGVRSVTLGGESADARLLHKLAELFPQARLHNVYASTEAGTLLVADGDVFAIAAGLEGRVVVRDGKIHVHRSLLGEFGAPTKPSPVIGDKVSGIGFSPLEGQSEPITSIQQPIFTPSPRDEDWYDTGDVVEVVSEQPLRFRIVARERDWVNVGGNKVNPHEVEGVLGEHPGVQQVRVFGRKNSVMGHILCAEIVLAKPNDGQRTTDAGQKTTDDRRQTPDDERTTDGGSRKAAGESDLPQKSASGARVEDGGQRTEVGRLTEAELRSFAAARLQPFKVPRMIRFVDHIATTRTGKMQRTEGG